MLHRCGDLFNCSSFNPNNIGQPDLYVVECLPRSAKQVFNVPVSNGPFVQKDLKSKTDLSLELSDMNRIGNPCCFEMVLFLYFTNIAAIRRFDLPPLPLVR